MIEQVVNVCHTTIARDAWDRGQKLAVHGWIYGLHDGLLRDLNTTVTNFGETPLHMTQRLQLCPDSRWLILIGWRHHHLAYVFAATSPRSTAELRARRRFSFCRLPTKDASGLDGIIPQNNTEKFRLYFVRSYARSRYVLAEVHWLAVACRRSGCLRRLRASHGHIRFHPLQSLGRPRWRKVATIIFSSPLARGREWARRVLLAFAILGRHVPCICGRASKPTRYLNQG